MKIKITFIEEVRNVSYLSEEDTEKVLIELEKYEDNEKEDKIVKIIQELSEKGEIDIWDNAEQVETLSLDELELDLYGNNEIETYLKNL
ncbi:MAG TPA: hypothetical protein PKK56_02480 [archaeon]|nr:hypothetical protein [archaeon]